MCDQERHFDERLQKVLTGCGPSATAMRSPRGVGRGE